MNAIASEPGGSGVCAASSTREPAVHAVELESVSVGGRTQERTRRGRGANTAEDDDRHRAVTQHRQVVDTVTALYEAALAGPQLGGRPGTPPATVSGPAGRLGQAERRVGQTPFGVYRADGLNAEEGTARATRWTAAGCQRLRAIRSALEPVRVTPPNAPLR